jgi:hypothetical protein
MDQSEYDSTNQEFKNFLAANNLNIETKDDLSCDLELKNRLLLNILKIYIKLFFKKFLKKELIINSYLIYVKKLINSIKLLYKI